MLNGVSSVWIPVWTTNGYDVTFALVGFKGVTSRVVVTVGANMTADAKLEVGNVTEKVTVTAKNPALVAHGVLMKEDKARQ